MNHLLKFLNQSNSFYFQPDKNQLIRNVKIKKLYLKTILFIIIILFLIKVFQNLFFLNIALITCFSIYIFKRIYKFSNVKTLIINHHQRFFLVENLKFSYDEIKNITVIRKKHFRFFPLNLSEYLLVFYVEDTAYLIADFNNPVDNKIIDELNYYLKKQAK